MAHFENITLEKGMYSVPGKSFTQVLEELDSSENYRGTSLEGLDAFQRQLKLYPIKVSGPGSGQVERGGPLPHIHHIGKRCKKFRHLSSFPAREKAAAPVPGGCRSMRLICCRACLNTADIRTVQSPRMPPRSWRSACVPRWRSCSPPCPRSPARYSPPCGASISPCRCR